MGKYIPCNYEEYIFAKPNGNVGSYPWIGDPIDVEILRRTGAWKLEEEEMAELQSMVLMEISPPDIRHWSKFDYKAFWEWVDDYEFHT